MRLPILVVGAGLPYNSKPMICLSPLTETFAAADARISSCAMPWTGCKEELDVFSLIDRYKIVRETRDGRMQDVQVTLSDWVFEAIAATEVLTLNKRYFQLARPLERRLYEIARKHCGDKVEWPIWLETLHLKTGSQSTLREFRRLLKAVIEDDEKNGHFPTYRFQLVEEGNRTKVLIRPKEKTPALFAQGRLHVSADAHMQSKEIALGWDQEICVSTC